MFRIITFVWYSLEDREKVPDGTIAPSVKILMQKLLKQSTSLKNSCGKPGVNGSKFNPNFKFGVNCYGYKPDPDESRIKYWNFNRILVTRPVKVV